MATRGRLANPKKRPALLDVFCGVGGWSKPFAALGWHCTGVDIKDLGYPGHLVIRDAITLPRSWVESFDGIVLSPPCEEFARAWLPWLRGDKTPEQWAVDLLEWSVALVTQPRIQRNRLVECSNFAARHVPGAVRFDSWSLWGDFPALIPPIPRRKAAKSGMRPELRAEIPIELGETVAAYFTRNLESNV